MGFCSPRDHRRKQHRLHRLSCSYFCCEVSVYLLYTDNLQKGSLEAGRQGWSGISHAGGMTNSLLLVAWPEADAIKTKFVWAP